MIKSILGGKSKNLFDISKVITSNVVKRNGNSLICSSYGTSIGTLGSICPTLKSSDLITISFKCASEGFASDYMSCGGKVFKSGATFLVSDIGLSTPWYLYSTDFEHRDIPNKTIYSDIQLEKGSTATEYVPHELTSYKSIMKVSDVCQLVDKSKFPDTLTKNGVTLTNNTDGSLTLNGTPETSSYSQFLCNINTVVGHKYALIGIEGGVASDNYSHLYRLRIFNLYPSDFPNPNITTATSNICSMYIQVMPNITVNNLNCKPQLFDLTEMFGAGNEPKTVAEFKSKFPNDYYPYSPSCFVTSFDERMPCKTKNLFSSSTEVGTLQGGLGGPTVARNFEENKWYQGFATNGYYGPGNVPDFDIHPNSLYVYSKGSGYGMSRALKCEPNTKYFISCSYSHISGGEGNVYVGYYDEGGNFISNLNMDIVYKISITTPSNCKWLIINFTTQGVSKVYFSDIQLVKGTTATDYVPYGYV